ncbi:MAG: aminotransferase class III-fold pyridoxal phosphate-dependent enzyme [Candidatus Omnitrophica bacterium]|nr:aminotransferase class III-fold pyridoxal phosphate-dependent enzyme [Candidatus Omnitrophota bacterium]
MRKKVNKSQALYNRAKRLIPGGTQLLSKRPEMFLPGGWPAYYKKAKGCEIWDLDGNKFIDMSFMGIGACILGYADSDVDNAVKKVIDNGSMSTLNSYEEVELAELLCDLHPWANMVRYARTGGEALAIAVRIARAKSKKDMVLFCGYHGWHDWYLSSNICDKKSLDRHLLSGLNPIGVPKCLKNSALPFFYNDTQGFLRLINKHKNDIGVIIIEAIRNRPPEKKFIQTLMRVAREMKIVFIVDEVSSGWRLNLGGAHLLFGIKPDIAVFAKGISNGFPMAAVIGKSSVMQAAQDTFISSTYWTERIGPAAALATIKKLKLFNVSKHLISLGKLVQENWTSIAERNGISIEVSGIYPLSHFEFKHKKSLALKTLFTSLMLERGFLATTSFYPSFSHTAKHIEKYLDAFDAVFKIISKVVSRDEIDKYIKKGICHAGFNRLT